jgi:hypothetical protein
MAATLASVLILIFGALRFNPAAALGNKRAAESGLALPTGPIFVPKPAKPEPNRIK